MILEKLNGIIMLYYNSNCLISYPKRNFMII